MADSQPPKAGAVQGEGDYVSAKKYDDAQAAFAKSGKVEEGARKAEQALDDPAQAADLEKARAEAAKGEPRKH